MTTTAHIAAAFIALIVAFLIGPYVIRLAAETIEDWSEIIRASFGGDDE